MPSFSDSIFLFVLALLLFGPKRLPVLARELGKWVGEFRRASNEFKMQMEEELRLSEQADRQKQIAAIEAAAPVTPPLSDPEHPHLPHNEPYTTEAEGYTIEAEGYTADDPTFGADLEPAAEANAAPPPESAPAAPLPIATSGDLRLMPPSTGLPTPQHSTPHTAANPLGGLLDSIPETRETPEIREARDTAANHTDSLTSAPETAAHGH
jgi:sec-independent protein translocase protein TatB